MVNIGDKVKLRSWNSLENEYGVDEHGDILVLRNPCGAFWVLKRNKALCGRIYEVYDDRDDGLWSLYSEIMRLYTLASVECLLSVCEGGNTNGN